MRKYAQLIQEQRYQIYALKKTGHNQTEIASVIGVHKSTVIHSQQRAQERNRGGREKKRGKWSSLRLTHRGKSESDAQKLHESSVDLTTNLASA